MREGQAIGVKVTLRGDRMWEFLDRLISVAIPRIRDFRGLPAHSWDGKGNYTFGLSEQTMFAEIDPDKADHARGMDITIVTTAQDNETGKALLDAYGFPFKKGADADNEPRKRRSVARNTAASGRSELRHGKESTHQQGQREAEVQGSWLHPLPSLRPGPFRLSQVRSLPFVPARARTRRRDPRPDEVVLVTTGR